MLFIVVPVQVTMESEGVNAPGVPEQADKTCPIKAQSTAIARAMASICNAERVRFVGMSGHGGFVHTFSGKVLLRRRCVDVARADHLAQSRAQRRWLAAEHGGVDAGVGQHLL